MTRNNRLAILDSKNSPNVSSGLAFPDCPTDTPKAGRFALDLPFLHNNN